MLYELSPQTASLEEAFMELTRESVEFHGEAAEPSRDPGGIVMSAESR